MTLDPRVRNVGEIATAHLFDMVVDLHAPLSMGLGPLGRRVFYPAAGGSFEGPKLRGTVLPNGGDWAIFQSDGTMTLDVRLTLRTDDDALILLRYEGRYRAPAEQRAALADATTRHQIDPATYYFRTMPLFETGAKQYAWLNGIVGVGSGYLVEGGIAYKVWQVL